MSNDPQDYLAVVTGASAGLGRALSCRLTENGVRVVGLARNATELDVAAERCGHDMFFPMVCNVADSENVQKVADEIKEKIGHVNILINNAAVLDNYDFLSSDARVINSQIMTNLLGQINCAKAFLPHMFAQDKGRIVNVGSFAGENPVNGNLGYSVSKAGTRCFSLALARELEIKLPTVIVSEWIPGILSTRCGRSDGIDPDLAAQWGVKLALDRRMDIHGKTYLKDKEVARSISARKKVSDAVLISVELFRKF